MALKTDTSDAGVAIDLGVFLPTDETTLSIKAPNGSETGWVWRLAGPSHSQTLAHNDRVARRQLAKSASIEQAQVNGKKYKADEKTPDEARRENVENIVARILGWNPIRLGAETIEFSREAAITLLLRPDMGWAYAQGAEALAEEKTFTKASANP
jgi:hypothetical protein